MIKLSPQDKAKLKGLHPDLVKVVNEYVASGTIPIKILEGMRTLTRQKQLLKQGATTTLRSRHLDGHAIDICPLVNGQPSFVWAQYYPLAKEIKAAARRAGVKLEWGGDWVKFKDGPHWQLPWKQYPSLRAASLAGPLEGEQKMGEGDITENYYKGRQSAAIGVTGAGGVAGTLGDVAYTLSSQQEELSSGDYIRIAIAGVIVLLTIAGLVWAWRR
jgi:peptidoglycan L-alanyl-D-glutamate endopeptidase CwlK